MISALKKNALPFALVLLCAAALYLVYRDMKAIEARLSKMDILVNVLCESIDAPEGDEDAVRATDEPSCCPEDAPFDCIELPSDDTPAEGPGPAAEPEAEAEPAAEDGGDLVEDGGDLVEDEDDIVLNVVAA